MRTDGGLISQKKQLGHGDGRAVRLFMPRSLSRTGAALDTYATRTVTQMITEASSSTSPNSLVTAATPTSRPARSPVLLVAHPDGYVEVYGDDIDVVVAQLPDVTTAEAEIAAEELVATSLPASHRELFVPGRLAESHLVERVTPKDLMRRRTMRQLHAAIAAHGGER